MSCPADIDAYEDEVITWDEPRAMDNVGIRYLWSSIDQGQVFDVGEHTVTYSAIDYDDNKAICEFNVNVYGEGKYRIKCNYRTLRLEFSKLQENLAVKYLLNNMRVTDETVFITKTRL